MIETKRNRISIVIPVYNEADHLRACLEAIAVQTVAPFEVLVVDNNSTDGSRRLAEQFPFVTLVGEPRQGVVYARDRGFNAARGDIIGRIDADSIVNVNWVETIERLFDDDRSLTAVTGRVRYYNLALRGALDKADFLIRRHMARVLGREIAMQGANMAVRRSAWQAVRSHLCHESGLHEDYDIAIHLAEQGHRIAFDERLEVTISFRQVESSWRNFSVYAWISPKTYALHGLKSRRHMYPVVALVILAYPLLKLLHKGYDQQTDHFSWHQLFEGPSAIARVNPATFVD